MSFKGRKFWIWCALAGVVTIGTVIVLSIQKPMPVGFSEYRFRAVNDSITELTVTVAVANPNWFSASFDTFAAQVDIAPGFATRIVANGPFTLKPHDTTQLAMRGNLNLRRLSSVYPVWMRGDTTSVHLRLQGRLRFLWRSWPATMDEIKRLPLKEPITIEVNKLMGKAMKFRGVRSIQRGEGQTTFRVQMEMRNAFPFPMDLQKTTGTVYSKSGVKLATWQAEPNMHVAPFGTAAATLELTQLNSGILQSILAVALGGGEVQLRGTSSMLLLKYAFDLPIEQKMKLLP